MKRSSIKDIAKLAGVSVATVSYVLNRKEGQRISEETRKKIFKIAETINYTPIARTKRANLKKSNEEVSAAGIKRKDPSANNESPNITPSL